MAANNSITIGHTTKLDIVAYNNEPVLTFVMIDKVHARTSDTARKRFSENKERFIEGKHYHMIKHAEAKALKPYGVEVPPRGLTLITERGYMLLVKSFTDDLAWEVQEQLVDHYFRGQLQALPLPEIECISNKQYYSLKNEIHNIASYFHMKESTQAQLANLLRFKFNVGGLKDLPEDTYDKAMAVLKHTEQQQNEFLGFRIELERQFVTEYLCAGVPFTGTIRKKFKEKYQMQLPHNPNWREAVDMLN